MPSLQVRELPEYLYRKLQIQAARSRRSVTQEAVHLLEVALGCQPAPLERRRTLLQQIAHSNISDSTQLPDPAALIREDRDR